MIDIILSQTGFFIIIALFSIGAVGALLMYEYDHLANIWGSVFAILGSCGGLLYSISQFISGATYSYSISSSLPLLSISIRVDYLASFFVGIISLISLICSVYAIGYVRQYYGKYTIGTLSFLYNIFIISMIFVVTANHALYFLIVWEIMALTSYLLVMYERKNEENIRAASLYFIMTHAGTAFIILAFLLLYHSTGSFDFDIIRNSIANVSPQIRDMVFIFALIGFGIKAGIIPLHIWLPVAHPAAPSHVSALMSGVMIKTGIYMMMRICLDFIPDAPQWWGLVILVLGALSALLGVLYALSEHDIKKLLAYHSIENIGIILLGLGSSLVFASAHSYPLALLSFVAALYHTMNHAIFKALLFLGAGSVISVTHTRNIEEYGGIIKLMPQTAFFFLVGSLAISALPPFNGFASEWLTFQALFHGVITLSLIPKLLFALAVGALAYTGGLAAACFVKAFGIIFLARPRSDHARQAYEVSLTMRAGMSLLALCTILLGIGAGYVARILEMIVQLFPQFKNTHALETSGQILSVGGGFSVVSILSIGASMAIIFVFILLIIYTLTHEQKIRYGRTWDCGSNLTSRMEITATGFSRSIISVFQNILFPVKKVVNEYFDSSSGYFPKNSMITLELRDVYRVLFYDKLTRGITAISEKTRKIQSGNVNTYILYMLVALSVLLSTLIVL